MENSLLIVAPFLIALAAAALIHPCIVKIAKMKKIVDNPNARKLQKEPVPILGGVVVYFGIFFSVACTHGFADCSSLLVAFAAMMIMLYTGTMDDILDLRPSTRFVVQILAVCLLIFVGHYGLDDLRGLWDIHALPPSEYIPLTIFACVGIVNALNLIDGVDGLSSGYCIMASLIFGAVFTLNGTTRPMSILALATAGSLLPFFLHNVFGRRSKMFIGDGGTLLMGITMSVFVMRVIQSEGVSHLLDGRGYSSVAFTLAVLSIPVFDTLRVMSSRMLKGRSPFHPDKTHLHMQRVRRCCGELYAAEAADALALAGLHKDRQPRRSVVVSKREQREAALFSRRGELLRRVSAVGKTAVNVHINQNHSHLFPLCFQFQTYTARGRVSSPRAKASPRPPA